VRGDAARDAGVYRMWADLIATSTGAAHCGSRTIRGSLRRFPGLTP
jgi:hypothetical protein